MRNRLALLGLTLVTSITLAACGRSDNTEASSEYGTVGADAGRAAPARANVLRLPEGTIITLRNEATISSRHHEAGHRVSAVAVNDVLDSRNRVVIAAGAKFLGSVKRIESATGNNDTALMHLEFNAIEVNGNAVPLAANVTSMDVVARGRGVTAGQAGKVGAGTVIGGAAGRVIGGNRTGTIVGAVIGTAAGVVVANATRETDIVLDRDAMLTVTLTGPFVQRVVASAN